MRDAFTTAVCDAARRSRPRRRSASSSRRTLKLSCASFLHADVDYGAVDRPRLELLGCPESNARDGAAIGDDLGAAERKRHGTTGSSKSPQSLEKRLRRDEVDGVESLRKALADSSQQLPCLARPLLSMPQAGKAHRGSQLPGQRALVPRPLERLPEVILRHGGRVRGAVQQDELAFQAQQFGDDPALLARVQLGERLVGDGEASGGLAGTGEPFR